MVIYVACPWRHWDQLGVMRSRAMIATRYGAALWAQGHSTYSPLAHFHSMLSIHQMAMTDGGMEGRARLIAEFNDAIRESCHEIHILMLPQWREDEEVQRAISSKIPKTYLKPAKLDVACGWEPGFIDRLLPPVDGPRIEKGKK